VDSEREMTIRKIAMGVALLAAAPLSVLSWVLIPASMVEGSEFVAEMERISSGRTLAAMLSGVAFFPLAVLGVLGLMHLLKSRATLLGTIGGGLAIVGLTLNTAAFGAAGTLIEAIHSGVDPAVTAPLVEDTMGGVTGMVALVGVLLAAAGTTLLGIALYRARRLPRLPAVLLAIYGPLQVVGFGGEIIVLITLSYATMALAFMPAGLVILRQSVEEWSRPPAFGWLQRDAGPANEIELHSAVEVAR
jgi:hypothetical protein